VLTPVFGSKFMKAFIFPGQGSQYSGMAKKLYDKYDIAKEYYEKAKKVVGSQVVELGFDADEETLKLTQNSQISIFLYSYILFICLVDSNKITIEKDDIFMGHSLGEISALAASQTFSFENAVKFVRFRGEAMGSIKIDDPIMAALLKPDIVKIEEVFNTEFNDKLFIANLNSPSQVVISGLKADFDSFNNKYQRSLFLKAILLKVSAPFHSPFMKEAEIKVENEIQKYDFDIEKADRVISNKFAKPYEKNLKAVRSTISSSITSQVRWIDSILYNKAKGYNSYLEIGPKSILVPFVKEIDAEAIAQCFID
jgi:[acyl-carrier-protein] S-malonyltransferase